MQLPSPVYDASGIRMYLADCLDILPALPTESVDMVVTDPPYGMKKDIANDGDDFLDVVGPALKEAWRTLKMGGCMFVFMSTKEIVRVANALGEPITRVLWLYKPGANAYPLHGYLLTSEAILWFVKGGSPKLLEERKPYKHDVFVHKWSGKEEIDGHPTIKPIFCVQDFVGRAPRGGIVLDPFLGAGTTCRAAKNTGRRAIGIEIEQRYMDLAITRMSQDQLLDEELGEVELLTLAEYRPNGQVTLFDERLEAVI